jgi:predicted unusual protein kinase regulating ubiquinone biosynthesis (AarF/ABC1/UbiB family)
LPFVELEKLVRKELGYELEAQHHRRIERLMRGHPFVRVPRVRTDLSTRRVLVSEYVDGERFEAVRRAEATQRDRYGEIVFRFFLGLLYRDRIALGDPHPGNYLLCPDGRVCFLDFGLLRDVDVDADRVDAERAIARAVRDADAAALKAALRARGYVRPDAEQRAAMKTQVNQFTLPPEAVLIRRMHGIVAVVMSQLRAGADWGAIAAEYLHGAPPATALGQAEAEFFASRGRRPRALGDDRPFAPVDDALLSPE